MLFSSCGQDDPVEVSNRLKFDGESYKISYAKITKTGPANLSDYGILDNDYFEYILELSDGDAVDDQIPENSSVIITVLLFSKKESLSEDVLSSEKYLFDDLENLPSWSFFYPFLFQVQGANFENIFAIGGNINVLGNEPDHVITFNVNFPDDKVLSGRLTVDNVVKTY